VIKLTMFNDSDVIVNADLIESVEHTPDTLISLTTGKKVMVKESVEDVISKVINYRRIVSQSHRVMGRRTLRQMKNMARTSDKWIWRQ
jgi:flagellar protein FlbD